MIDPMNELTQHRRYQGTLFLQQVSGDISGRREAENEANAGQGAQRDMYAYVPQSGCPHPKQCQVVMVLRSGRDEDSALEVMARLGLDRLAEEKHFLLLFPNPVGEGWNFDCDPGRENDMDYLIRCFGILKGSQLGVSGFNGMIFYIADCPEASALLMTMAARKPINVPAMMIGAFPEGYSIPENALGVETAAWVSGNEAAAGYLKLANGISSREEADGVTTYFGTNPNCRLLVTDRGIDADTLPVAWERLFSETRRWQNDTHGTYQKRPNFTQRGFVAHVKDTSLGCDDGYPHTWYEYIPPQLRGTEEKVPLVFYFHGGGCVPLYGAEQSGWHDIADEENFIVVYPEASQGNRWGVGSSRLAMPLPPGANKLPKEGPVIESDFPFFRALIEHMKTVHPIDETRIYVSGFSSGGVMTHCTSAAHTHLVAAAAPCNAALTFQPKEGEDGWEHPYAAPVPVFQNLGFDDRLVGGWPIQPDTDDLNTRALRRWKQCNSIPQEPWYDPETLTGLAADENFYEDPEQRFFHQRWHSTLPGSPVLLEVLIAKRMPHALDLAQPRFAWQFMKKFRRMADGTLKIEEE